LLLLTLVAVTLTPSVSFASNISKEKFIEPPEAVHIIAFREGFEDFPKPADIVTVARIESSFNPKARNKMSKGIMQVNNGSMDLERNMVTGIKMLRDLYLRLGSAKSAIIAYNIGIGNFHKRRFMKSGNHYYKRFNKHREKYENFNIEPSSKYVSSDSDVHSPDQYHVASLFSTSRIFQLFNQQTNIYGKDSGEGNTDQVLERHPDTL